MGHAIHLKNSSLLDERIDQFCEKSAALLTDIHEKYNSKGKQEPKKKKRGRPRKNGL